MITLDEWGRRLATTIDLEKARQEFLRDFPPPPPPSRRERIARYWNDQVLGAWRVLTGKAWAV